MNIENDFMTDFDLFGKTPELYYKNKSKKSSVFGIVLTFIYIILYIAFLIYKLVRMFQRVDVTFYDSYTFKGIPSIKLTNNEFYGGFGMGQIVDERMYSLDVYYISKVKVNGKWENTTKKLDTEICQLEWFGKDYQEIFADQPLGNYYCIKDVSGMVLEGYSNLERFSYFEVVFYPCVGKAKNGEDCYTYEEKLSFFTSNLIELKIQDNDLNPTDYKFPVIRRQKDMNSPVFKDLFQLIYSYLQIVNIETDEDITGLNFFSDTIRKEQYLKYDESFLIASPLFYGDILQTGGPIADVTLQLAAKVLTEKRQYVQLIDVLGDVGGLMEILFTFLNIISSFVTEILYDKSLVNDLFSFDINKKMIVINKNKVKNSKELKTENVQKIETMNKKEELKDIESNKNIEIYSKKNPEEQIKLSKSNLLRNKKQKIYYKSQKNNTTLKNSQSSISRLKTRKSIQKIQMQKYVNKLNNEEDKNIISIDNRLNELSSIANETNISTIKELKNVYINNWLICCFWCTSKKKNINKVLFEEGSKLITERLDILNIFNRLYINEIIEKNLGIGAKDLDMTDKCKYYIRLVKSNNNFKTWES